LIYLKQECPAWNPSQVLGIGVAYKRLDSETRSWKKRKNMIEIMEDGGPIGFVDAGRELVEKTRMVEQILSNR